jgi:hypothetical protein
VKIGEAYVELSAKGAKLDQDFKKAQTVSKAAADKIERDFKGPQSAMAKLGGSVNAARMQFLAIAAAISGVTAVIASSVKATIQHRDAIGKMSKATGIAVETLSAMEFVAERSGSSLASFTTGYRRLVTNMEDSTRGLKEAQRNFEGLGIRVTDTNGNLRDGMSVFLEVAEKMKGLQNEAERSALAIKLFGRSGLDLVPMMKEGASGIQALISEAERLGIVFSKEAAEQAEDAADAITNYTSAIRGLKEQLASRLLPELTAFISLLTGSTPGNATIKAQLEKQIALYDKLASGINLRNLFTPGSLREQSDFYKTLLSNLDILEKAEDERAKKAADAKAADEDAAAEALELEAKKKAALEALAKAQQEAYNARIKQLNGLITQEQALANVQENVKLRQGRIGAIKAPTATGGDIIGIQSISNETARGLADMQDNIASFADRAMISLDIWGNWSNMLNRMQSSWADSIGEWIRGAKSFGDAMADVFEGILDAFINTLAEMAAQQMAYGFASLFSDVASAGSKLTSAPATGGSIGVRYTPGMAGGPSSTTININAVDAGSFANLVERNPDAIISVVQSNAAYKGVLR